MGEVAMDRKDDWDVDQLPEVKTKSKPDGEEFKEPEVTAADPTNEKSLDGLDTSEGVEGEFQHVNGAGEIEQIEDRALGASGGSNIGSFSSWLQKDVPGEESEGGQASTLEPNVEPPPANPSEEQIGEEGPVSLAQTVDEELSKEKVVNGWSPQQKPEKKSLVKSGEQTEEKSKEGPVANEPAGPKIEYFCTPNQNLTSDAWKVFFYHMLPFTAVPLLLMVLGMWFAYLKWGWSVLLFYIGLRTLLVSSTPVYSKRIRAAVSGHFYLLLARYVPSAQYVVPEKPFPEDRPYIFACHPHGRMFYSTTIFSQLHSTWGKNILRRGDLFMTAAGTFFSVPLVRNVFYLVGVIPAGKKDIVAKLKQNDHVTILIGGVKEVLLGTEANVDRLYLKKRKGFCKIAISEKAGVVPVYFFNENQMFQHNSKSFLRFWERVNKYLKVGVPLMRGRFKVLPMPFRRPLMMAVGEPLFAMEGESVDAFHERYMEALRKLFDKYVPYSPNPNRKLIIQ